MNALLLTTIEGKPVIVNWGQVTQINSNDDAGSQILFSVVNEYDFHSLDVRESVKEIYDRLTAHLNQPWSDQRSTIYPPIYSLLDTPKHG
ncbi:hypothetical protein [Arsenicibacter rosenii]|uniref:Uncharacterized protein n=1 Tax=Arsenicibacter rosenii TaxID=1750698 RepID=A0A1S2VBQ3_9BACT|nr:hypothetical protein [Arsenicibacter rosenii]OIN55745.1 hypothetical protein BLX24_28430 [Arsenicibacter rosenii]